MENWVLTCLERVKERNKSESLPFEGVSKSNSRLWQENIVLKDVHRDVKNRIAVLLHNLSNPIEKPEDKIDDKQALDVVKNRLNHIQATIREQSGKLSNTTDDISVILEENQTTISRQEAELAVVKKRLSELEVECGRITQENEELVAR